MPYSMGWTGAQYSTPPSGNSPGSYFAYGGASAGNGGNATNQVPTAGGAAPTTGVFGMSDTMSQVLIFAALVTFLAAWHAHAFSLME
jgi:hypothetical protein